MKYRVNPPEKIPVSTLRSLMDPGVMSKLGLEEHLVSQDEFDDMTEIEKEVHINLLINHGYEVKYLEKRYNINITLDG